MGASKQLIMAFAPAAAVSIAMLPFGAFLIILILFAIVAFFWRFPHLLRQLQDAWNADMSLQQFREIEMDLKENAKQLRHFVNLKLQVRSVAALCSRCVSRKPLPARAFAICSASYRVFRNTVSALLITSHQIKKERKYDIAKVLQDEKTMQWWCLQFGSQTSSVATDRFIQALVQDQPTYEKARKDAQVAISSVIRDIIGTR